MNSQAFVELAMKILSCTQKELASRLDVSATQITKWKKGEYISADMEEKFKKILNIDNLIPEFVLIAGSIENAKKWDNLIHFLADFSYKNAETGYKTAPLKDDLEFLSWQTFHTLKQMGVNIPTPFPIELEVNYNDIDDDEEYEKIMESIEKNQVTHLIQEIFSALNNVYGFYAAYISELIYEDNLDLFETDACQIEDCLMELAACKIEVNLDVAPNFKKFRYETRKNYEKWINIVKDKAFRGSVPLRAELLNLVYDSEGEIGSEAEAESLGFNKSRIHPDIYMNELLVGMRIIHQVLPAIMKKLDIHDEFELDISKLSIK